MAKDKSVRIGPADAANEVTIRHGNNGSGLWAAPDNFSEPYNGPDVTIKIDEKYKGGEVDVPPDQEDHVYAVVGDGPAFGYVPLGSDTAVIINCAGPGGP